MIEYLYHQYDISAGTSLNAFIKKKFIKRHLNKKFFDKKKIDLITTQHVKMMINALIEKYYVTYKAGTMEGKSSDFENSFEYFQNQLGIDENHTFENIYVEIQLTTEGLDYANQLVNTKAIRKSTVSTNKWLIWLYILLVIFAAASAIIQWKQYYASYNQSLQGR